MSQYKSFKIRKFSRSRLQQELQDASQVLNLQDAPIEHPIPQQTIALSQRTIHHVQKYLNDEQNVNCYRFVHQNFCGCDSNCLLETYQSFEIVQGLLYGSYVSGLKSKYLLEQGVTHVLNVSCKEYTKRKQYFYYLNIDLQNNTEEDAKKFFRLANRFIKSSIQHGGKVFIHASKPEIAAVMMVGYMIGVLKIPLKQCLQSIKNIQISPHFMKQIQSYDMQKMSFVSITRA